jgi:hypothetical protein
MSRHACTFQGCETVQRARGWCTKHYRRWQVHGDPSVCTTNQNIPVLDRFWMKVQKGPGCWIWTGAISSTGYGSFGEPIQSVGRLAHRIAYALTVGPIPEGKDLDHTCHNRACVNPSHLRPVSRKQNSEHLTGPTRTSTTGVLGVTRRKRDGRYVATVQHNGDRVQAGSFATLEEAGDAVKQLRLQLFTHNDFDRIAAA